MLTRLKVDGFKNLDRIDVRLGPFTCVAGPNGVGKSNLFDAISFLAALAEKPLVEAASIVRGGDSRRGDVWGLFRRTGDRVADSMRFTAEFVIPEEGEDELGQAAKASMTFLQYELELRYRQDSTIRNMGALEIVRTPNTWRAPCPTAPCVSSPSPSWSPIPRAGGCSAWKNLRTGCIHSGSRP